MSKSQETCPICKRTAPQLIRENEALNHELIGLIRANVLYWQTEHGICQPCFDIFHTAHDHTYLSDKIFRDGTYQILPTPLRVGADERFTGRNITIAFLDSGFYPHPDLTQPQSRIKRYVNVLNENASEEEFHTPDVSSWHGMMTSVVAAGNGFLSNGFYRGIASDASVVLVKVGTSTRISHKDIERGLEWVLAHKDEYNIRIVNVSCGGDYEESYLTDSLSQTCERAVRAGIVVVCAAGNAGTTPNHAVLPPASSPSVITVGGFNDHNTLEFYDNEIYQSSYGPTIDGLLKPEIVAPSIWLAAPILPDTPTSNEAEFLAKLKATPDAELRALVKANKGINAEIDAAADLPIYLIRQLVNIKIHDTNVINSHYKHVDGTSFAAPIVSSVIAQMLEANPNLTPQQIKRALIDTAIRLENVPVDKQGWGVVIPSRAVNRSLELNQ